MAKIQINDVNLDGGELFNNSETFLNELQDGEIEQVVGGLTKVAPKHLVISTHGKLVNDPDDPIVRKILRALSKNPPRFLRTHPQEPVDPVGTHKIPSFSSPKYSSNSVRFSP